MEKHLRFLSLRLDLQVPVQVSAKGAVCSVIRSLHVQISVEEFQTCFTVDADQIVIKGLTASEQLVKILVSEADDLIVFDGTAVIHPVNVCPKAGTQTHRAGLTRGIELTTAQVKGVLLLSGVPYGGDFTVTCGIVVFHHLVVSATDDFAVLDDHAAKSPPC